ncbi:MAG: alpha/beta fold hydrolase [Candidatus Binataceae bacterium]
MQVELGRFPAEVERPEPLKFAWPIVLLPELFSTPRHLAILHGFLATLGWEVYAPDLRAAVGRGATPTVAELRVTDLLALAIEAIDALGNDAIIVGHGLGGLLALKLAEQPRVRAGVALAPLIPGVTTPLVTGLRNRLALSRGRPLAPPTRRTLFEFVADAEPFLRDQLIASFVPDSGTVALEIARGEVTFARSSAPRLVVAGDSDVFAPADRCAAFAQSLDARLIKLEGRGHWIVSGRAVERAVHEIQRFLVRSLGGDLLLLYPDEWKEDGGDA